MLTFRLFFLITLSVSLLDGQPPYVDNATLKKIEKKYKVFTKRRFIYLQKTLDSVKNKSDMEKLEAVNNFYNDVRYMSDIKVYKKKDYWATPYEFLGKDMGDCEDYVIAKYFALKYLGVDTKKLFFTYVRSTKFKAPHMVLTYFKTPHSEPLVLDNNNRRIFPASKRKDLIPIYNFNGDNLYKVEKSGKSKQVKNQKAHTKWNELLQNIKRKKI